MKGSQGKLQTPSCTVRQKEAPSQLSPSLRVSPGKSSLARGPAAAGLVEMKQTGGSDRLAAVGGPEA